MKETQEKKKNKGLNILIVLLLTITIVASSIGLYAWAKYTSSESGEATAQVAKWHFELKGNGTEETEQGIKFPITRTDKNTTVANDRLAPGTFGQFDVIIDTTNTEVSYVYDIYIEITNCPTNLKFYANNVHTTELKTERNDKEIENRDIPKTAKLNIKRYVPVKYADATYKETIYWDWAFETLDELEEDEIASTEENDKIDTADQNKEISMNITAIGTEVIEKPEGVQEVKAYIDFGKSLVGTEETSDDWVIFYEDEEEGKQYVYAMLADYLPCSEVIKLETGLKTKNEYGVYYNNGSVQAEKQREEIIKILKDKNKWKMLLSDNFQNHDEIEVTGAIDIQTWVKSWNKKGYTALNISGDDSAGYKVNITDISSDIGCQDTLYFPHKQTYKDCKGYRLASPYYSEDNSKSRTFYITNTGKISYGTYTASACGIRPVVKIPADMLKNKTGNVWKIEV